MFVVSLICEHSLKEFLPQSYMKVKAVEKKIFGEHKKHNGLTEIEAKVVYVKTARSLSTYGVTFFLVKVFLFDILASDGVEDDGLQCAILVCFILSGKNEGQKQIGTSFAGRDKRFRPALGRTNQRDPESVAVDDCPTMGSVTQHVYSRFRRLL